jgi:hypothetical protein
LRNISTPSYESSNFVSESNSICGSQSNIRPFAVGAIVIILGMADESGAVHIMRSSPLEFGSVSKYWLDEGGDEM